MANIPNDNPFQGWPQQHGADSYTVLQTARLDYVIRKIQFMRQTRFHLDDHMYSLHVIPTTKKDADKTPLVLECLQSIEECLASILKKLRAFYNERNAHADDRERCYVTICHEKLKTGIKVGKIFICLEI